MLNERTQLLISTMQKLLHRGAHANIQRILAKSHSADIADVLQNLTDVEAFEVFKLEARAEGRARLLSYLDNEFQKKILDRLSSEEASELVTLMDTDDAADLLAQLPAEESLDILEGLESQDSTEVVDLMTYPEDSAGGIMNSDYADFNEDTTVEQVVQSMQSDDLENKILFYIYVQNKSGHLVGVVSLKQLLLSKKSVRLKELMHPSVISVKIDTHQEQVARTVERYDFLSVPVVDENNKLVGVITVDDVIDVIREEAQEDLLAMGQAGWGVDMTVYEHFIARLPWLVGAFIVGAICFGLVIWYGTNHVENIMTDRIWILSAFIPVLLAIGSMAGNQSATVMVGATQTGHFIGGRVRLHLLREVVLGTIFSTLFAIFVYAFSAWMLVDVNWHILLALSMFLQVIFAVLVGTLLPLVLSRIKLDPAKASVPLAAGISDIVAILILFGLFYAR